MLSKEEVKNIALLARIGIKDDEISKYQEELSAVLDFFRELETVATDDVVPIGHITGRTDVSRADRAEDFGDTGKEMIKKNFPDSKDGFLKVKSVF
jgi:aspartyl-tRNA(Asn)/glutamyl-tRNA(Gln) amidotransferase subunit C